ncbi:Sodium/hydrogen_exchanger [Hexamita inflata]|uniref:Sodium/hydrogen exchanger n=1 Tax=Hexamita inflata TaxID=28002 RepID=A0ABP1I1V8_9EUKA
MTTNSEEETKGEFKIFGFEADPVRIIILFMVFITIFLTVVRLVYDKTKMKVHFPESTLLVIIGLILGFLVNAISGDNFRRVQSLLTYPSFIFLYIFVPIIIFDATYFLNKRAFFHNFVEIAVYAVVGTLISNFIIGFLLIVSKKYITTDFSTYEHLTYAALVSAVDPVAVIAIMESMHVNENIFNIAFGESTLNDGVAMVLFNLFKGMESLQDEHKTMGQIFLLGTAKFLVSCFGSIILAIVLTLGFCLITKLTWKIPNLEPLVFLLCALCCYVFADMCLFSGVIAVMTCALVLTRYGEYNIQKESLTTFTTMTHMLAQTFETMLFLDMGFQIAFSSRRAKSIDFYYCFMIIPFSIVARLIGVLVQTVFLNMRRKKLGETLTLKDQFILLMCGLRGGIAFALAQSWGLSEQKQDMVTLATCLLILFTIVVYGLTMRPVIKVLKIKLEPHAHDGSSYPHKCLAYPQSQTVNFMNFMTGNSSKFSIWLSKVDSVMQKIFLKQQINAHGELVNCVEQLLQESVDQKREATSDKNVQLAKRKDLFTANEHVKEQHADLLK